MYERQTTNLPARHRDARFANPQIGTFGTFGIRGRGVKIYRLNIGQPDLPTPQKALDVLKHIDRKTLEYSPSQGYRSLRKALVNYYDRYQIKLDADEIIITCGGSEAVLFAFMSCLNPGDEIIVPEPAYANYMSFAVSAGRSSER